MYDTRYLKELEKRINNTEKALMAFWVLIEDTMPPACQDSVNGIMRDYLESAQELGGDFKIRKDLFFKKRKCLTEKGS